MKDLHINYNMTFHFKSCFTMNVWVSLSLTSLVNILVCLQFGGKFLT